MTQMQLKPQASGQSTPAGRRYIPNTRVLLIFTALALIASLTASLAAADSRSTPLMKGNTPMPLTATASGQDVPSLDNSLPDRVETFTFVLG